MTPLPPLLAPSLLAADHGCLAEGAAAAEAAGCQWLHVDIMDGHFVPNLTFGPGVVRALRPRTRLLLDTHLMVADPGAFLEPFARAGSDLLTFHLEVVPDPAPLLARLRSLGVRTGLALNPDTPASLAFPWLGEIDLVLAMTVQPGFGGQPFRTDVLPKIGALARERARLGAPCRLEVDGGVDATTARLCRDAGADTLVAGTAFFRAADRTAFRHLVESPPVPSP